MVWQQGTHDSMTGLKGWLDASPFERINGSHWTFEKSFGHVIPFVKDRMVRIKDHKKNSLYAMKDMFCVFLSRQNLDET